MEWSLNRKAKAKIKGNPLQLISGVSSRRWSSNTFASLRSGSKLPTSSGQGCCPPEETVYARLRALEVTRVPQSGRRSDTGRDPPVVRSDTVVTPPRALTRKPSAGARKSKKSTILQAVGSNTDRKTERA